MNAGSYVIIPNSSAVTFTWRRSVALMVPSWIGISYCLPVRLSVIVSVSAIAARIVVTRFRVRRLGGYGIAARQPSSQVRHFAALAAERTPPGVCRLCPAVDAQRAFGGAQTPQLYRVIW